MGGEERGLFSCLPVLARFNRNETPMSYGLSLFSYFWFCKGRDIESLNLGSCPWSSAQELETGVYGGVLFKTANVNSGSQVVPAIMIYKLGDNLLQLDSV